MNLKQAEKIVELILADEGEASLYPDYSGRGMFGKTVPAVVTGDDFGFYAAKAGLSKSQLPGRRDHMGKTDMVYY